MQIEYYGSQYISYILNFFFIQRILMIKERKKEVIKIKKLFL